MFYLISQFQINHPDFESKFEPLLIAQDISTDELINKVIALHNETLRESLRDDLIAVGATSVNQTNYCIVDKSDCLYLFPEIGI